MLCEISSFLGDSLLGIWLAINAVMALSVFVSSSSVFYHFYWRSQVTFDKWQYKVGKSENLYLTIQILKKFLFFKK